MCDDTKTLYFSGRWHLTSPPQTRAAQQTPESRSLRVSLRYLQTYKFLRADSWGIFYSLFLSKNLSFSTIFCNICLLVFKAGNCHGWLMFGSKDRVRKVTSVTVILSPHWIASCSCRLGVKMYKCVFSAFKQWSQQNFLNVFDLMKPVCSFPPRISLFQLYLTLME